MDNNIIKQQTLALEALYNEFNTQLFSGALPSVALTIQSQGRKNAYGWCSVYEVWKDKKAETNNEDKDNDENTTTGLREINLSAEHMGRGINDVCSTLVHEMVHLCNLHNGIVDCNPKSQHHNNAFKELAEKVGLIVEKSERRGWSITSPGPELISVINRAGVKDVFNYARTEFSQAEKTPKAKKPINKYTCHCGVEIKTSKELNIICGECESRFEIEEK